MSDEGQRYQARANLMIDGQLLALGWEGALPSSADVIGCVSAGLLVAALPDGSFPDEVVVVRRCCGG